MKTKNLPKSKNVEDRRSEAEFRKIYGIEETQRSNVVKKKDK